MTLEEKMDQVVELLQPIIELLDEVEKETRANALAEEDRELNLSSLHSSISIITAALGFSSSAMSSIKWNIQLGLSYSALMQSEAASKAVAEDNLNDQLDLLREEAKPLLDRLTGLLDKK